MHSNRNLFIAAAAILVVIGLTVSLFIMPNYSEAAAVRREMSDLHAKIAGLESQTQVLDQLNTQVKSARAQVANDLKVIPDSPDVASLIRKLSQTVDHVTVVDQTFTAGSACSAITGGATKIQLMPLTVDMDANFESIFALIRNAESLERLVRVASVRVLCKRDEKNPDQSTLKASVGLEAIFIPGDSTAGGVREEK